MNDDSAPVEFDTTHKDAALIRWVMRRVARELRDDPEFTNPVYARMAEKLVAHAFSMLLRWIGITVLIAAGGGALILLGALGKFPQWLTP